jgi:hypothetical protein
MLLVDLHGLFGVARVFVMRHRVEFLSTMPSSLRTYGRVLIVFNERLDESICFDEGSVCRSERRSLRLETGSTKPASEKPAPT